MKKLFLLLLCLLMTVSMVLTSCKDKKPDPGENPGEQTPGTQNPGENPGGNNPGGNNPGGNNPGGNNPGGDNPGGDTVLTGAGIGAKISDLEFTMDDSSTGKGTLTATILEGYVIMDESGAFNGYGNAKLSLDYAQIDRVDAIDAKMFIENNVLYLSAVGTEFGGNQQALDSCISMDVMKIKEFKEIADAMTEAEETLKMIEANMPAIEQVINESLAPIFAGVNFNGLTEAIASYLVKLTQSLYTSVDNGDGTKTLTFTVENLLEWNDAFANKSIAEVVDIAIGEGTIADIEAFFASDNFYNFTVAELLSYLKDQQGVDVAVLLDTLDLLVAAATGTPGATVESLLPPEAGLPPEFDLSAFLEDEDILALSVKDALKVIFAAETPEQAVEMFKGMSADIIGDLNELSVYDVVASVIEAIQQSQNPGVNSPTPSPIPGGSSDAQPVNETLPTEPTEPTDPTVPTEPDPAKEIESFVASILGMIDQTLVLTFTADANDVIIGTHLEFELPGETETDGLTVTLDSNADATSFYVTFNSGADTINISYNSDISGATLDATANMSGMQLTLAYSDSAEGIGGKLELSAAGTIVVINYESISTGTTLTASVANAQGELGLAYASTATGFTLDVTFEIEGEKIVLDVDGGENGMTAIINVLEGTDELVDISITVGADKLTVILDLDIEGDSAHAKLELVPATSITLDKEGLDALKAELANGKALITPAALGDLLTEKHEDAHKVFVDTENKLVYVVYVVAAESNGNDENIGSTDSDSTGPILITQKYNFNVQIIDISDCFGYALDDSCTDIIAVSAFLNYESVIIEGGEIQIISGTSLDAYVEQIVADLTLADVAVPGTPAEEPILNNETVGFLYNTKDQTYSLSNDNYTEDTISRNGHVFVYDAAASNEAPENYVCETVYYSAYKCSTCGDTYVRYYSYSHSYSKSYVYNETLGGFDVYKDCDRNSCNMDTVKVGSIVINSVLDYTVDHDNATISITVGENDAGEYRIYTNGGYPYLHYSATNNSFGNLYDDIDKYIALDAGVTYTFSLRANSDEGYNFFIEAA